MKKRGSFFWLMGVSFLAVGLLLFCQFFFGDSINEKTTFFENTHINGINVSGMTKKEADDIVTTALLKEKDDVKLTLIYEDKSWQLNGSDFETVSSVENSIAQVLQYGRSGNIFNKKKIEYKIKKQGLNVNISFKEILGGVENRLNEIIDEIEKPCILPTVAFDPKAEQMFYLTPEENGIVVDRQELNEKIEKSVSEKVSIIEIPTKTLILEFDKDELLKNIKLRGKFKTSYQTSSSDRKSNVKKALEAFNGKIILPDEEISFNSVTGPRNVENGYKKANIIVGGVYVSGAGGGVCQASTTLYNALLLSDIEILQVNHHSLPASYVPLSFDAMVSEGFSDLVFKNTTGAPIYIKSFGDESFAYAEIYGAPLEDGMEIKTKTELVRVIGHGGDKIITDTKGEYSDFVLYKGEYYRLRYPREGYESKGYVQYVKNGEVVKEKEVRHDYYMSQNGIIVEGKEKLEEGMTIPANSVKYIPPQVVTPATTQSVKNKLEKINPSYYNP